MHTWLFHVIKFSQIAKPTVLRSAGFTSYNLPSCVRGMEHNRAWIRLNLLQLGEQTAPLPCVIKRSAPSALMTVKGGGVWRTTIFNRYYCLHQQKPRMISFKSDNLQKKSKALFLHTGRKKTSESLIELVFRSDFSDHFYIESYEQYEFVSADLRAHDGFLAVWRRL